MRHLQNLSIYQLGTLKYVDSNVVTLEDLGTLHGNTLYSLLHRKYLERGAGKGRKTVVTLSKAGEEALGAYLLCRERERKHAGELTERCARMLKVVRVLQIGKREPSGSHAPGLSRTA